MKKIRSLSLGTFTLLALAFALPAHGAAKPPADATIRLFFGAYSSSIRYPAGSVVVASGTAYVARTSTAFKASPGSNPALWEPLDTTALEGAVGPTGATGATGATGDPGSIQLTVGTVQATGNTPSVTVTGSASNPVLNITFPNGRISDAHNDTSIGAFALSGTAGFSNTAFGYFALHSNSAGNDNTAVGQGALSSDGNGGGNSGSNNTGVGTGALSQNVSGFENTAVGEGASQNQLGSENTAVGEAAMRGLPPFAEAVTASAMGNTAIGFEALKVSGSDQGVTAVGFQALVSNTSGAFDIAIGAGAGANLVSGSGDIYIGDASNAVTDDPASENNTIRIGEASTQTATYIAGISGVPVVGTAVVVGTDGQLGIAGPSSRRFKQDIADMGGSSASILRLRPVTFHYRKQYDDGEHRLQYGLIAEEVAQILPEMVVRDKQGQPMALRYELLGPLLLNEFLKEHKSVLAQEETNAAQAKIIAAQQSQIEALTVSLEKVTNQINAVAQRVEGKDYQPVANHASSVTRE